jgi:RNA polymerase sigma factor (sigma-70 family)
VTAPQSDDGPVDAFRSGDPAALADLYARWSPLVYSLALRSLGDVARAEEVTRRVFTRAWASRSTADPARGAFSDWLVDLARDAIGDLQAEPGRRSTPPGPTNLEELAGRESKTGVLAETLVVADGMSHLGTLPQRLLRLALERHLTLEEVAEQTGLGVEKVRSEVTRSLMELRERLKEVRADAH